MQISFAQKSNSKEVLEKKNKMDSLPLVSIVDSSAIKLKLAKAKQDSITKAQMKKDIETTIEYKAKDSLTLDAENRKAFLYRDSEVNYGSKI